MTSNYITSAGALDIKPSSTSSENDFYFLIGGWTILNKKLKSRLTNSNEWIEFTATGEMFKVLTGLGNVDRFNTLVDGKEFEGLTMRLFNPATRLWSIYWVDSNSGVLDQPVLGSFENNIGTFFCKDTYQEKEIIMQFQWDASDPQKPIWSQAFSIDNGKTWEWNWYMYFTR